VASSWSACPTLLAPMVPGRLQRSWGRAFMVVCDNQHCSLVGAHLRSYVSLFQSTKTVNVTAVRGWYFRNDSVAHQNHGQSIVHHGAAAWPGPAHKDQTCQHVSDIYEQGAMQYILAAGFHARSHHTQWGCLSISMSAHHQRHSLSREAGQLRCNKNGLTSLGTHVAANIMHASKGVQTCLEPPCSCASVHNLARSSSCLLNGGACSKPPGSQLRCARCCCVHMYRQSIAWCVVGVCTAGCKLHGSMQTEHDSNCGKQEPQLLIHGVT
jgi:hypothetical protein